MCTRLLHTTLREAVSPRSRMSQRCTHSQQALPSLIYLKLWMTLVVSDSVLGGHWETVVNVTTTDLLKELPGYCGGTQVD
jgi:hypothetical protein